MRSYLTRDLIHPGRITAVWLLSLSLVAAGSLWDGAPVALGASGPQVIAGHKAGPLIIPSPKAKTMARLALPKGSWLVIVKASITDVGAVAGHVGVNCHLRLGTRSDSSWAVPGRAAVGGTSVPMLLMVAGRLGSGGTTRLDCVGEASGLRISDIRFEAVRAGKLTLKSLASGATKTTGTGKPRIISGRRAIDEVEGDGAYHAVTSLPLPSGAWWVVAKAVGSGSPGGGIFNCRLNAGADYDQVDFGLRPRFGLSEATPFGLQVVHRFGAAGQAALECKGPDGFDVNDIVITAVKVGKLSNRPMAGGPALTTGTGWPRVISGWLDGPQALPVGLQMQTVAQLSLPKGRWVLLAKAWLAGDAIPPGEFPRAVCQLVLASGKDVNVIEYIQNPTRIAPLVLSRVRDTGASATLKLRCARFPAAGSNDLYFIKLTAFRAGTLAIKPL